MRKETKNSILSVEPICAFNDNYIWAINVENDGVVIVDPGDAQPVIAYLKEHGLTLRAILITHHHADHMGGVDDLLSLNTVPVYASAGFEHPFEFLPCADNASIKIAGTQLTFDILSVPGHTLDHIVFYGHGSLFCGDTLFSGGCGRVFEGTPEMMHHSLMRLAQLSSETRVYCGHEYTVANLKFALSVDPDNEVLANRLSECEALRADNMPTLPSTIGLENQVNPFLRAHVLGASLAAKNSDPTLASDATAAFAYLRGLKDNW